MRIIKIVLFAQLFFSAWSTYAAIESRKTLSTEDITPSDVYVRARLIEEQLLTFDPERKLFTHAQSAPAYKVANAQPREVFFLAKSLNFSAKRLSLNYTNQDIGRNFAVHVYRNQPIHVYRVLNEALKSIQATQNTLSIAEFKADIPKMISTPTHVYNKILRNNRLLSLLNRDKIQPQDVIKIVDHCYILSQLLFAKSPVVEDAGVSVTEDISLDKTPTDVFIHLIKTLKMLQISTETSFNLLSMEITASKIEREIEPSDVLDLAMALNAQLTFLAYQQKIKVPGTNIDRQEVTPSHVFYLVSKIQATLEQKKR
ncbi:hypothetical protein [Shewanella nanhaiensis]|uniref:Uncharacterized protein n=1 Tax=Shewanella nanhaiensis TaxID=2864872 RepID=A0ABS7EA86_9GAMM|nr:hypothetical protein [Shewanella nanhaiensis]MBW8186617.1 hypothetical protein [Shewanella nanhaiensis]